MNRKPALAKAFVLILVSLMAVCIVATQPAKSQSSFVTIHIRADGTIDPPTVPIQPDGDVYTFTGDIYGALVVERDNVVIDGAGYKLQGNGGYWPPAVQIGYRIPIPESVRNNVTLTNIGIVGFECGVDITGSHNTISGINVTGGTDHYGRAVNIGGSDSYGRVISGSNNVVRGCRIIENQGYGIFISASGTVLSDNYIADNGNAGICFVYGAAVLRNNTLINNGEAFDFMEYSATNFVQDIDDSNTVDGMPVCYWVNKRGRTVPSNAGYVYLITCSNITVQGLSLTSNPDGVVHNSNGIYLIATTNTVITNNTLKVGSGISIMSSSRGYSENITIAKNNLASGIFAMGSHITIMENSLVTKGIKINGNDNLITRNNLTKCEIGINLRGSENIIIQNNVIDCETSIRIFYSHNNTFYHNNFVNNKQHVFEEHYTFEFPMSTYYSSVNNTWDAGYPSGGNYWSDYNGTDNNGDGIGDIPYIVYENYTDRYPLMNEFIIPEFPDTTSPTISIVSPENKTYTVSNVSLTFTVSEPTSWSGYSLDGQAIVTIAGNTTLTGLSLGEHTLIVYTRDVAGNTGASEIICFSIKTQQSELFPTTWIVGAIVIVAVVGATLLVYFVKVKKTAGKAE